MNDVNFRLSIILRLLQTSTNQGVAIAGPLRRQLDAVSRLVQSNAEVASSLAVLTRDIACAMSSLEEGAKLTKWVENVSAVLEILPQDETGALRSRLDVVRHFVETVQSLHESLGKTRMSRSNFTEWWHISVGRVGLSQWQAGRAIFAEVEVWPRVAQGIDPGSYAACAARLMAWRAHTATFAQGEFSENYYYDEALRIEPSCLAAMEGLARLYERLGEHHTAWDWYRRALDSGSVHPSVYEGFARISASQPQLSLFDSRAIWAAERAVAAMPVAEYWDTLAEVRERQGDLSGALECAQEALRDDEERVEYQQRLQRLSQLMGYAGQTPMATARKGNPPPNASGELSDDLVGPVGCNEEDSSGLFLNRDDVRLDLDAPPSPSDCSNESVEGTNLSGDSRFLLHPSEEDDDEGFAI